ncbi:MAG: DNA translocase FtsK 4TM domain-containing protein [Gammaproteobacteria bacterium]|nr:DNA translocase FtsK 4TM domain-containing protein [Gammaproteobacteria bacterium]MBU1655803.1 DNA translocase FtsK 4TM domain-containing protein [Gammaproteobacteria bacterium]MBU1962088.1 DNA translocase FtsK 4TM domain-containing protein [Gammaproteobacteria bacterium]
MFTTVIQARKLDSPTLAEQINRRMREGGLLLVVTVALMGLLALTSYSSSDPGWSFTGQEVKVDNLTGRAGAWFADVFFYLFGLISFLFPFLFGWVAWDALRREWPLGIPILLLRWAGLFMTLFGGTLLGALQNWAYAASMPMGGGGVLGHLLAGMAVPTFNPVGSALLSLMTLLLGITLLTGLSWFALMEVVGGCTLWLLRLFTGSNGRRVPGFWEDERDAEPPRQRDTGRVRNTVVRAEPALHSEPAFGEDLIPDAPPHPVKIEPRMKPIRLSTQVGREKQPPIFQEVKESDPLPPLFLLDEPRATKTGYSPEKIEFLSRQVEAKLKDFGVLVEVVDVHPGPVVTLFELQLAPGTKASKVTGLSSDLARSLSTISVRVVEVIPGKTTIGLEIPNEKREMVYLGEILRSSVYEHAKSLLTMALGKDISGDPAVADLGKMPHILVAGTTGSGKSVAINAMILSLLYKATPEQVRLIMVDPKMLELSVYEGIPHLLTPVVTDMKEAANALRWCVAEMERRYKLMASQGVRNIAGFNRKVEEANAAGEPIVDPFYQPELMLDVDQEPPVLEALPYIVVVIDELADMMMVVGKKVEELIARLAQKARAAGIHLLLATQRPSVDVITGLIKANIPTRLSFQVSSRIDSRTILDQMGAENLLGNGDSLFMIPGGSVLKRIHGAFVDDHEVHAVVEYLKKTGRPNYLNAILQEPTEAIPGLSAQASGVDVEEADPLYDEAVNFVIESRRASISSVQRKLKIGYNRAARLIEEMERVGIVSSPEHNGNRQVLVAVPDE